MTPPKRAVYLVSRNIHKYLEARQIFLAHGLNLVLLRVKALEIQSENLEDIAKFRASYAAENWGVPVISEDAGLFVDALNGFPGPYSSYAYKTIGCRGILRLLEGVENRRARFRSAVAYCPGPNKQPLCFVGETLGRISTEERGSHGFGFDPIFIPEEGDGRTFAEMTRKEKNRYSHRARAMTKFVKWYLDAVCSE
ncbi:MAG TPA: XTP/dITP diphosphatase [Candidatus Bathyarchaeota archaeon]|nr:XTP/dITP diphosphatase [Candidatus Bathyarchaeota archaeon]